MRNRPGSANVPITEIAALRAELVELRAEISRLRVENARLKLKANPRAAGRQAEELIATIIGGERQSANAPYDLLSPNGARIEVKFSSLTRAVEGARTMRWVWLSVFGTGSAQKEYDRLILVGADTDGGVVIFDVPREEVETLIGGRNGSISANANALTSRRGASMRLHRELYVTEEALAQRYQ